MRNSGATQPKVGRSSQLKICVRKVSGRKEVNGQSIRRLAIHDFLLLARLRPGAGYVVGYPFVVINVFVTINVIK